MESELFIRKKPEQAEETDFQQMQREALETIQRLSGNLWTDFNEHDPGITIMDALNYALTELDYKCSFPLEDYLCSTNEGYRPEAYGLFRPDQVYPSNPVTEKDYCKLVFDSVEEIAGLWMIKPQGALPGTFDMLIDLIPTATGDDKDRVEQEVFEIYHANRNLCENLRKIIFRDKKKLELVGEVELEGDAVVSEVLARAYFTCARYFNPGIKYLDLRQLLNDDPDWPSLFDGPLLKNGIIDDTSVKPVQTKFFISDLHEMIRRLKGVRMVKNIFLTDNHVSYTDEIDCTEMLSSCTVGLPESKDSVQLLLLKSGQEARFNFDEVKRWYKRLVIEEYGHQNQYAGLQQKFTFPKGNFNDLPAYSSVQNDFPDFWGVNQNGVPDHYSDQRKAQAKQLKGYLLGFDLALAETMQELGNLGQLLNIDAPLPELPFPDLSDSVAHWEQLIDREPKSPEPESIFEHRIDVRNTLFDLLDSFYGEKSRLPLSEEFDTYQDMVSSPVEKMNQRAAFIRNEPLLIPERSRAVNHTKEDSDNLPGLKKWFALVMGLPVAYEMPVTNVFSKFSLRLLSDKEFYDDMKGLLNLDFVINNLDENFKDEMIFDIPEMEVPDLIGNYNNFRGTIYLLNHNIIFESYLRNGIRISNYKIVQPEKDLFLLTYHSEEQAEWVGLGRFDTKNAAVMAANQLKELLIYLNRHSENVYLVEHLLLDGSQRECGYTFQVSEEGTLLFALLNPVSRDDVYRMGHNFEKALADRSGLQVRQSDDGTFVILFDIGNGNAIYCQQTFDSEDEAVYFLDEQVYGHWLMTRYYYQLSEGVLLSPDFMDFGLTVVLPNWSARFYNTKFRDWCEELIEERCPAHVKLHVMWLPAPAIRQFEKLYFAWRSAMASGMERQEKSVALAAFLNEHHHRKHGRED